jgi:hypothetical protein
MLKIPMAEVDRYTRKIQLIVKYLFLQSLEGRMKNDLANGPIARYKLIDCTEFFSKSMSQKSAINRISEIHDKKMSIPRRSSVFWNLNEMADESESVTKQRRLRSLLAKDFDE